MARKTAYVPVLRSRKAEHDALRELSTNVRTLIAPVIEITPALASRISELSPQRIAQSVWRFAIGSGGTGELYIDIGILAEHAEASMICSELEHLILAIHADAALVVRTGDFSRRGIQSARELLRRNGAAFRVTQADYDSPELNELVRFLRLTKLSHSDVDLLVDCQMVEDGRPIKGTAARLERDFGWRSLTYIGGSFPPDLSGLPKNGEYELPRLEWRAFRGEKRAGDAARYGDYTIQHPLLRDPLPFPPSASIRYTGDQHWVVMRGEKPKGANGPGREQYIGHAQLLRDRPEFCGREYSAGDAYIDLVAGETTSCVGNPTKWVQAGANHHMTLAARQAAHVRAA